MLLAISVESLLSQILYLSDANQTNSLMVGFALDWPPDTRPPTETAGSHKQSCQRGAFSIPLRRLFAATTRTIGAGHQSNNRHSALAIRPRNVRSGLKQDHGQFDFGCFKHTKTPSCLHCPAQNARIKGLARPRIPHECHRTQ